MIRILIITGTRPNFVKITQFPRHLRNTGIDFKIVHTGQHYDETMSDVFFEQFGIKPDIFLYVSEGTQLEQISEIIKRLEIEIKKYYPQLVIVVGDVNSTFAGAFAANRLGIKVAHVESGLRSFDPTMPEEWNRTLTDAVADYLFVTEKNGITNLKREGKKAKQIFFVGNTMIDTLVAFRNNIEQSDILSRLHLEPKKFILMTMHRPATVDVKEELVKLAGIIRKTTEKYKLVFPIHPRTLKNLKSFNLYFDYRKIANLVLAEPMDYFSFQKLTKEALLVLTDSGGIQEETTFLKVPCLTLRNNTERPVTISLGTNELTPFDENVVMRKISLIERGMYKRGKIPPLWDGRATERIVKILSATI